MNQRQGNRHVLIYEPGTEGHHIGNLRFVSEGMIKAGYRVTLAVDTRPESLLRIREQMQDLLGLTRIITARSAWDAAWKDRVAHVAECLGNSSADAVFLPTFDEIASQLLRRSAFGAMPPASLRGKLGGIYMRPRFLEKRGFSLNSWLKSAGFMRLLRQGWFRQLLFLDPFISRQFREQNPGAPVFSLPDPYPDDFTTDRHKAMTILGVPGGRPIFLFYGGAYRRKGLHLAVRAMLNLPKNSPALLLCAGKQPTNADTTRGLARLEAQGRAVVINRYVSTEEEKCLFAACDFVLLPYINHYGNSGVLSRAAGAGKAVIASDEQLVGRLVRKYEMGLLFRSGNVPALQAAILSAVAAMPSELGRWHEGARAYAKTCSRTAFETALIAAIEAGFVKTSPD